jgi:ATP-dependent RNA helicase RhlE
MLDMGFLRDVERVINILPEKKQTMLFSATMPAEIERLTKRLLKNPVKVAVDPVASTVEIVDQRLYYVNKGNKARLLIHLLKTENIISALVFTRTKHGANKLTEQLRAAGESCEVIHANKAQTARQAALEKFKSGKSRVLVATDIVARGIDIIELSHVVNYDLPESPEDYVHRIGRTARAGLDGTAIAFCDLLEIKNLDAIEKLIGKRLRVMDEHPYILHDEAPEPPEMARDRMTPRYRGQSSSRPSGSSTGSRSGSGYGSTGSRSSSGYGSAGSRSGTSTGNTDTRSNSGKGNTGARTSADIGSTGISSSPGNNRPASNTEGAASGASAAGSDGKPSSGHRRRRHRSSGHISGPADAKNE